MVKPKKNIKKLSRNENSFLGYRTIMQFVKKHKIWALVILILVGFFGWKYTSIYLEKRDFLSKQKQLEQLADKVASQYPPDSRSSVEYCEYSRQKISKGDLSCTYEISIDYKNIVDSSSATQLRDNVLRNLNLTSREVSYNKLNSNTFKYSTEGKYWNAFIADLNEPQNCFILFSFRDPSLVLNLQCTMYNPKTEYFPVKK